ncbi:MAG: hypothetical protein HZC55_07945 [Verrucomicrobia bacterium]|nr:hypothetical protein [Verrucomicrobiota bacterium]
MKPVLAALLLLGLHLPALPAAEAPPFIPVKHYRFSTEHKDAQMWSALYIASNGKIYVGLCTHADAANLYEFDPATEKMRHLANLTEVSGERGQATWTNGKIHVQMQELDGWVYFGSLSEDNGPPVIDAATYRGPYWYRAELKTGRVEQLSRINSFWGLLGQAMDPKRRLIYGLAENGHLYKYHIDRDWTEDLGRVDEWDICRTIFTDDRGNCYGSYPPGRIWKYDVEQDRVFDLEHLRLPLINQSRTMANPMLDRKTQWRIIEWDPVDKVAYGIIGGSNLLFKCDPHAGPVGAITPLAPMAAPTVRDGDPFNIPYATLAMALSQVERKIYYVTVMAGDFDYGSVTKDVMGASFLVTYDLKTGRREDVGVLRTTDGRTTSGMGGAKIDAQGRLWVVGAFSEPDPRYQIGRGGKTYSMGLACYDPRAVAKPGAR